MRKTPSSESSVAVEPRRKRKTGQREESPNEIPTAFQSDILVAPYGENGVTPKSDDDDNNDDIQCCPSFEKALTLDEDVDPWNETPTEPVMRSQRSSRGSIEIHMGEAGRAERDLSHAVSLKTEVTRFRLMISL